MNKCREKDFYKDSWVPLESQVKSLLKSQNIFAPNFMVQRFSWKRNRQTEEVNSLFNFYATFEHSSCQLRSYFRVYNTEYGSINFYTLASTVVLKKRLRIF